MKQYIFTLALSSIMIGTTAQNNIDATRFNNNTYEGTARSVAMGNAFGALGADLSAASINPAGLGRFRSNEISMTLGVNINNTNTNYYDFEEKEDKISVPINHIGMALHTHPQAEEKRKLAGFTFALTYNRLADFNTTEVYRDKYGYNSLLDYFCMPDIATDIFSGDYAYRAGLIYDTFTENGSTTNFTHNVWELPYGDGQLDPIAREDVNGIGLVDHAQKIKKRGSKDELAFATAWNIQNKFFIGASMGIQSLTYKEKKTHKEEYFGVPLNKTTYTFTYITNLRQNGTGINFKLGAIFQPIKYVAVGLSLHTPTFYAIDEEYYAIITRAWSPDKFMPRETSKYNYKYRSPGRFVASLAGFIGQYGIISFDYERSNYGKSVFKPKDDEIDDIFYDTNNMIEDIMAKTNSIRIGAEAKITSQLSVRAGFKHMSSPTKDEYHYAYKNKYRALSGGVGYRLNFFYVDLAYVNSQQENEHWVLPDMGDQYIYEPNSPASLKSTNHNVILTAGIRF